MTTLQACMREASRVVLGGLELGSDAKVACWPGRYSDPRGEVMWGTVTRVLDAEADHTNGRYAVEVDGIPDLDHASRGAP